MCTIILLYPNKKELIRLFIEVSAPLCESESVLSMDTLMQHGTTSCLLHSLAVAYFSLMLVAALRIHCDKRSLVRGALLHDYFLYDWHIPDVRGAHKLHGFTHPGAALENAKRDFKLNATECNIIARHMFPLTPKPPRCRESLVVCLVDKYCAVEEFFRKKPYAAQRRLFGRVTGK